MTTPPRTQAERNADNALDVNRLRARNAELEAAVARVRALHPDPHWCTNADEQGVHYMLAEYGEKCPTLTTLDAPVETLHGRDEETGGKS